MGVPRCGAESLRSDGERPELKEEKPTRTHWDMLRERRSIAELEDLLAERLNLLRAGELGSTAFTRNTRPKKTAKSWRTRQLRASESRARD